MSEIYELAEDSFLLSDTLKKEIPKLLKKNKNLKFLEVGCGSGINLQTASNLGVKKENIFGTDINGKAVTHCKKLGSNCFKSDLFSNIKGRRFDVIVFNPPYLPLDKREPKSSRLATTSGKKGNELTLRFLKQAKIYLNKKGKILIITSSLSSKINFKAIGYKTKEIAHKKLFFERLSVVELSS